MAKTTTRWGHPYPEIGDAADVPKGIKELAESVDSVAMDDQGNKASRPAAGKKGRYYLATDEGILYRDNGTEWLAISGSESAIADGAVTSRKFKPTYGHVSLSETLTLSSAEAKDVFSIAVTPAVSSHLRLWIQLTRTSGGGNGQIDAYTKLDSEGDVIVGTMRGGASQQESGLIVARVVLTPGAHTVKVRAKLKSETGALFSSLTRVMYDLVSV